jgi:two-component system, LuxR family, sensor kinase FixL
VQASLNTALDRLLELDATRIRILAYAVLLVIAAAQFLGARDPSLGYLYIVPMLLLGLCKDNRTVVLGALTCAGMRIVLGSQWDQPGLLTRLIPLMFAYSLTGIVTAQITRRRIAERGYSKALEKRIQLEQDLKDQLRVIVETTPLAIITIAQDGRVLLSNQSARKLLNIEVDIGANHVRALLPDVWQFQLSNRDVTAGQVFAMTGTRTDGATFRAYVWASRHRTPYGKAVSFVIWDYSEELRNRETDAVEWLSRTSHVLISAALHEVQNLASAALVTLAQRSGSVSADQTSDAQVVLGLVKRVHNIALRGLYSASVTEVHEAEADMQQLTDELRIVLEPVCRENNIQLIWLVPKETPTVSVDHQTAMQVLLNLCRNSVRAMRNAERKVLQIHVIAHDRAVHIRIEDSGPGVAKPSLLFQPYQEDASGMGLGVFVSRALVRSFGGELRYEQEQRSGACFVVELSRNRTAT